ncbi:hypothetical protein [Heliophilum fasciatum]|uniref:Uncharacterized protein n=1 Tax=Heliophilum fasciatum TaxID=35700 RepID=A0A4R2RMZ3_9FIRM|nr:hypothetical protein [Heliophilum fasciatum]MCW2277976.1 hypothetical protein [Heliophilum fasciatum]TCP64404.1 hypothetical protein EDD73_110103 [Heliophilum fasciatum]
MTFKNPDQGANNMINLSSGGNMSTDDSGDLTQVGADQVNPHRVDAILDEDKVDRFLTSD